MSTFSIQYVLKLPGQKEFRYLLSFDEEDMSLILPPIENPPEWTRLEFCQCSVCPLDPQEHPHCPLAVCMVELQEDCCDLVSFQDAVVEVTTRERTIVKETTAQKGISALMGLIMPTSGCPCTRFFRPMARFHLPFATEEETLIRAASMYLLGQYFRGGPKESLDLKLEGLKKSYETMQVVNQAFASRLKAATKEDASVNALVLLDLFAKAMPLVIEESLEELSYIFNNHI